MDAPQCSNSGYAYACVVLLYARTAEDWGQVFKTAMDASVNVARIHQCVFQGKVVLGRFSSDFHHTLEDGVKFASGCYRTTIRNAVVLDDALVQDTMLLNNAFVDAEAVVMGCGPVVFKRTGQQKDEPTVAVFGNGMTLHVGVETGGRDLRVFADLPFACTSLTLL